MEPKEALMVLNHNLFDLSVNPYAFRNFEKKNEAFDVIEQVVHDYDLVSSAAKDNANDISDIMCFIHNGIVLEKSNIIKVLEVLKKKKPNLLEVNVSGDYKTYLSFFEQWNWHGEYDEFVLTEEEFKMVKEWLK